MAYRSEAQFWLRASYKRLCPWGDICDLLDLEILKPNLAKNVGLEPLVEGRFKFQSLGGYKPVAYLSFHNQYKYYQLAEKYKLLVKLPFGIVGLILAVQPYYTNEAFQLI